MNIGRLNSQLFTVRSLSTCGSEGKTITRAQNQ